MCICPCPWQGGWTRWTLMVPSNPKILGLLWYEGMTPAASSKHHLLSLSAAAVTEFHPLGASPKKSIKMRLFVSNNLVLAWSFLPMLTALVLEKKNTSHANYFKIEFDFRTSSTGSHYATSHQPKVLFKNPNPLRLWILTFFFSVKEVVGPPSASTCKTMMWSLNSQMCRRGSSLLGVFREKASRAPGVIGLLDWLIAGSWCQSTASAHQHVFVFSLG